MEIRYKSGANLWPFKSLYQPIVTFCRKWHSHSRPLSCNMEAIDSQTRIIKINSYPHHVSPDDTHREWWKMIIFQFQSTFYCKLGVIIRWVVVAIIQQRQRWCLLYGISNETISNVSATWFNYRVICPRPDLPRDLIIHLSFLTLDDNKAVTKTIRLTLAGWMRGFVRRFIVWLQ